MIRFGIQRDNTLTSDKKTGLPRKPSKVPAKTTDSTVRLQKFLSERGVASRRHVVMIIMGGRVRVNNKVVREPGARIHPIKDKVIVNGKLLPSAKPEHRTILLNKPRGYICSASDHDGQTVYDLLPKTGERLVPVGRLDKNSEGLLLLSNDGDLVHKLTHPRFEQAKTYNATVSGNVNKEALDLLRSSMLIEGYRIRPAKVRVLRPSDKSGRWILEFILKEGRKRQIRMMCEQAGLKIHRLTRVKINGLSLAGLQTGKWRDLTPEELKELKKA